MNKQEKEKAQDKRQVKEDKLSDRLAQPKISTVSSVISLMIDKALNNGNKIYLGTDWHLYKKNKEDPTKPCIKNPNYDKIISECIEKIQKDDVLIFMGDIVDGECLDESKVIDILKRIPGKKIFVRGNNDLFSIKTYTLSGGCKFIVDAFEWDNIIFTHRPVNNTNKMNIHGHIHNSMKYYDCKPKNHIDVAHVGGMTGLVELQKVIDAQKEYIKKTSVVVEKLVKEGDMISMFDYQLIYEYEHR